MNKEECRRDIKKNSCPQNGGGWSELGTDAVNANTIRDSKAKLDYSKEREMRQHERSSSPVFYNYYR